MIEEGLVDQPKHWKNYKNDEHAFLNSKRNKANT